MVYNIITLFYIVSHGHDVHNHGLLRAGQGGLKYTKTTSKRYYHYYFYK